MFLKAATGSHGWTAAEGLGPAARVSRSTGESVLVTGDLNAVPPSPTHGRLTGRMEDYPSPLADCRREANADSVRGPRGTYHSFSDTPEDRVDYVFAPRKADVLGYRTLGIREEGYRSDHLPVAARFRL